MNDSFKYICLCSMLLKTSFLLPHLFCNVEFELIQLISQHRAVVRENLILKIEMLLEFQNTTNFKIIGFFRINAFWIPKIDQI